MRIKFQGWALLGALVLWAWPCPAPVVVGAGGGVNIPGGGGNSTSQTLTTPTVRSNNITLWHLGSETPYQTLSSAKSAAVSGDLINVSAGTYDCGSNTLVADGVNWYFAPGAVVSGSKLWIDSAGAATFKVGGYGVFKATNVFEPVLLSNALTVARIEADSIQALSSILDGQAAAHIGNSIYLAGPKVDLVLHDNIFSIGYDAVWVDRGNVTVTSPRIWTDDNAFEVNGGLLIATVDDVISTNDTPFNITGGTNYFSGKRILPLVAASSYGAVGVQDGETVVAYQQIFGRVVGSGGYLRIVGARIGGESYPEPPVRITAAGNGGLILENCTLQAGTNSLSANCIGSRSLQIIGALSYDKPLSASLTLVPVGTESFAGSAALLTNLPNTYFEFALSDETTALTTGTAKVSWRAPFAFHVNSVRASLTTVSSSGLPTVNIKDSGTTIFSTKLTIDASELTSTTAATAAVLSDVEIADDALVTFDVDVAGTGAAGLKVKIYYTR